MKDTVVATAVQFDPAWLEPGKNAARMVEFIDRAAREDGAELVVFPELSNLGYITGRDKVFSQRYMALAETLEEETANVVGDACRRNGVYALIGMALRNRVTAGMVYNAAVLFGPDGTVVDTYLKTHIAAEEKHYFIPGDRLPVFDTELGKIGVMICYDALFPEVARTMTLRGAEILVAMFNSPMMDIYQHDRYAHLASVRAWENKAFTICCNRVGTQAGWTWLGHSAMSSAAGKVIAYSDSDQEDVITATFHGPQILEERAYLTTFRDRRPDLYGPLIEPLSADVHREVGRGARRATSPATVAGSIHPGHDGAERNEGESRRPFSTEEDTVTTSTTDADRSVGGPAD